MFSTKRILLPNFVIKCLIVTKFNFSNKYTEYEKLDIRKLSTNTIIIFNFQRPSEQWHQVNHGKTTFFTHSKKGLGLYDINYFTI